MVCRGLNGRASGRQIRSRSPLSRQARRTLDANNAGGCSAEDLRIKLALAGSVPARSTLPTSAVTGETIASQPKMLVTVRAATRQLLHTV